MSDSSSEVKKRSTPFSGGASAIGLVVSITVLPARFSGPQRSTTASAARPLTASVTRSPNWAASANEPTAARSPAVWRQAASLAGEREPRITSKPWARKPFASTSPTTPDPRTATRFAIGARGDLGRLPPPVLLEVLLHQPVDAEALQLGGQHQDLVGAQRMVLVDHLQDVLEGRLEVRVVGWSLGHGWGAGPAPQGAAVRVSAAGCISSAS